MVELKDAYKMANDCFLDNEDYLGVREVRETEDKWLFEGKLKHTTYGTFEICVPKNGDEPYLYNPYEKKYMELWEKANVVKV